MCLFHSAQAHAHTSTCHDDVFFFSPAFGCCHYFATTRQLQSVYNSHRVEQWLRQQQQLHQATENKKNSFQRTHTHTSNSLPDLDAKSTSSVFLTSRDVGKSGIRFIGVTANEFKPNIFRHSPPLCFDEQKSVANNISFSAFGDYDRNTYSMWTAHIFSL